MCAQSAITIHSNDLASNALLDAVEIGMRNAVTTDSDRLTPLIATACSHHLMSGGQRVRARLALHAGLALGVSRQTCVILATACELLHNASLIHDDLQDQDRLRHGVPTIWSMYGSDAAICAGDLMLASAYGCLSQVDETHLLPALLGRMLARTTSAIHGQCADLSLQARTGDDVTTYKNIAIAKSGALLSLPTELALVAANQTQYLALARAAAEAFAVGYQIVDDIDDVEKDRGVNDVPRSLNVVLLLQKAGHGEAAEEVARDLGLRHFEVAMNAAQQLPKESGDLLVVLARQWSARL